MPSAVVHLKVAYDLRDELGIKDDGRFYVGAVSPDAVNIDGFASQEVRYGAHIRSTDYKKWKQNVIDHSREFVKIYAGDIDFYKGFLLHLLTDIFWDELVQPKLFEGLKALGADADTVRELKWKELYRFNSFLAGSWLYDNVFAQMAKVSDFPAVSTVSPELLERYIRHLYTDYMNERAPDEKPLVLDESCIPPVEQACIGFMREIL